MASPVQSIGAYDLLAELGHGNCGYVFKGRHKQTGAERAIKIIRHDPSDPTVAERFRREAEAMARVDGHPNLVRVHESGVAGRYLYYVMELVPGSSLRAVFKRGPLPPVDAARIFAKLARALAHCHARGLVHRDVKPENVLMAPGDGSSLEPKLADLGLVRDLQGQRLTVTGEILGTPAYMSPEQAKGEQADGRSDVYGLGAMLFEAVSGQLTRTGRTATEVLSKLQHEDAPSLKSAAPKTPATLVQIVDRCLARPREKRPHAAELATQLEAFVQEERLRAAPRPPVPAGKKILGIATALAVGGAFAAFGFLGVRALLGQRPSVALPAAPAAPLAATREQLAEAEKLLRDARVRAKPARERLDLAQRATRLALGAAPAAAALRADAQEVQAQAALDADDAKTALDAAKAALAFEATDTRRVLVGQAATRLGDHASVADALAPVAERLTSREPVQLYLGALLALGRTEDVKKLVARALVAFPNDMRLSILRARALRASGALDEAKTALNAASIKTDPEFLAEQASLEIESVCQRAQGIHWRLFARWDKEEPDEDVVRTISALARATAQGWPRFGASPPGPLRQSVLRVIVKLSELVSYAQAVGTRQQWTPAAKELWTALQAIAQKPQDAPDAYGALSVAYAAWCDQSLVEPTRAVTSSMSVRVRFGFHVGLALQALETGERMEHSSDRTASERAQGAADMDEGLALSDSKEVQAEVASDDVICELLRTSFRIRAQTLWRAASVQEVGAPGRAEALERAETLIRRGLAVREAIERRPRALLDLASILILTGRLEDAERVLKEAEGKSLGPDVELLHAAIALERQDWGKAADIVRRAQQSHKDWKNFRPEAWAVLKRAHEEKGETAEAERAGREYEQSNHRVLFLWLVKGARLRTRE